MPTSSGKKPTRAPWSTTPTDSVTADGRTAISREPPATIAMATRRSLRCPYRSPSRESSGVITAKATWDSR